MGRDDFVELVKEEFQTPGYAPAEIHEQLWGLDFRITITPNFDNIYDSLVAQRGNGTVSVKQYYDNDIADSLRTNGRVLIKSHGSVTHPDRLIFSRVDYAKARNEHRDFYGLIDSLLRTHSFLFVGCGLDDPDIRLLLEDYCYRHQYAQSHYFVLPARRYSVTTKKVLEESLKLKLIEYKTTVDHSELTVGLRALVSDVERERDEMGSSQSW
ncbi:SIR2 family NAD-dependent protein deacylase [Ralstonia pseudosolanacearum]